MWVVYMDVKDVILLELHFYYRAGQFVVHGNGEKVFYEF